MRKYLPRILAFSLTMLVLTTSALAEKRTFTKEYTFKAGEEDSMNSSRTIALREAKKLLLEEVGTYLESITEVKGFKLTRDQITTLTAGIIKTELVGEQWDGHTYWLKAKIDVDSGEVVKSIDALRKDRVKIKELEEARKRSEELLQENERLKRDLLEAKGQATQEQKIDYNRTINELAAIEWYERGHVEARAGNTQAAVDAYTKAIEMNPKYADAYITRGVAYGVLSKYHEAIKDFNKIIKLDPKHALAYANRGYVYGQLGDLRQELLDYNTAIEMKPKPEWLAIAYYLRGQMYYRLGIYTQAIEEFNKALKVQPLDVVYSKRGGANEKVGNTREAIQDYTEAIKLNSQPAHYNNRGVIHANIGNNDQAIKDFTKAIEIDSKFEMAYLNRGITYGKIGNFRQAVIDYDKAVEIDPKLAEAYYRRGSAYFKLGKNDQSITDMKTAARLGDKDAIEVLKGKGISW